MIRLTPFRAILTVWLSIFLLAHPASASDPVRDYKAIAGAAVEHVVRPTGQLNLPADENIVVPAAVLEAARVQASPATAAIVAFSPKVPAAEFTAYPGTEPPAVVPRKASLTFYPCSRCHENLKTNPTPRVLMPAHEVGLQHGGGRFWCLTCHDPQDRDQLHTLGDNKVDFDEAWRVCGQCHQARQKDWYFGAHGKRFYSWQGEPVRYNCTQCHNPHRPPFMHRKAQPPPPVRAGLEPMLQQVKDHERLWDKHADRMIGEHDHD